MVARMSTGNASKFSSYASQSALVLTMFVHVVEGRTQHNEPSTRLGHAAAFWVYTFES